MRFCKTCILFWKPFESRFDSIASLYNSLLDLDINMNKTLHNIRKIVKLFSTGSSYRYYSNIGPDATHSINGITISSFMASIKNVLKDLHMDYWLHSVCDDHILNTVQLNSKFSIHFQMPLSQYFFGHFGNLFLNTFTLLHVFLYTFLNYQYFSM